MQTKRELFTAYLQRSLNYASRSASGLLTSDLSWKREMPMFMFNNKDLLQQWKVGCDADIGGLSEAFWGLTASDTALLWGNLSTDIPPLSKMRVAGYAGERPYTMFHRPAFDVTQFRYIAVRVKGDSRKWFVNIQSDSVYQPYLWQHRMRFKTPGEWETVLLPVRDFVLTAHGNTLKNQVPLARNKIKTIGFSILRQPGEFSLEIEWVKAVNSINTYGDMDLLDKGQYLDTDGKRRTEIEGVSKAPIQRNPAFSLFPVSDKDKKWF